MQASNGPHCTAAPLNEGADADDSTYDSDDSFWAEAAVRLKEMVSLLSQGGGEGPPQPASDTQKQPNETAAEPIFQVEDECPEGPLEQTETTSGRDKKSTKARE